MTCVCGHPAVVHHLTPNGVRTWCTVHTHTGPCHCTRYTEEGDG